MSLAGARGLGREIVGEFSPPIWANTKKVGNKYKMTGIIIRKFFIILILSRTTDLRPGEIGIASQKMKDSIDDNPGGKGNN